MLFAFKQVEPCKGDAQSHMQPNPETTPVEAKSSPRSEDKCNTNDGIIPSYIQTVA